MGMKRGHGDMVSFNRLVNENVKDGLIRTEKLTSGIRVLSLVDNSFYDAHPGEKGYHPLRRYIQKLKKLDKAESNGKFVSK